MPSYFLWKEESKIISMSKLHDLENSGIFNRNLKSRKKNWFGAEGEFDFRL